MSLFWFSGVVERQHQQILDGFRSIIMDILFDTSELKRFFSANHPRVREMLQLGSSVCLYYVIIVLHSDRL